MIEESTTRDLVELARQMFDAASRHDLDELIGLYIEPYFDAAEAGAAAEHIGQEQG